MNPSNYGSTAPQLEHQAPESPNLSPTEANTVKQVVGTFLYHARAVDPTMLMALKSITVEQVNITESTTKSVTQLLNYAATHPEPIKRYNTSGMILHIHSDASFLSEPGAKRRAGGYNYLSTASADPKKAPPKQPPFNGPVHAECTTMINILASATESEIGSLFVNCQRGALTHIVLIEMGHDQPPTPAVTDSATGDGFVNDNILQRR